MVSFARCTGLAEVTKEKQGALNGFRDVSKVKGGGGGEGVSEAWDAGTRCACACRIPRNRPV